MAPVGTCEGLLGGNNRAGERELQKKRIIDKVHLSSPFTSHSNHSHMLIRGSREVLPKTCILSVHLTSRVWKGLGFPWNFFHIIKLLSTCETSLRLCRFKLTLNYIKEEKNAKAATQCLETPRFYTCKVIWRKFLQLCWPGKVQTT